MKQDLRMPLLATSFVMIITLVVVLAWFYGEPPRHGEPPSASNDLQALDLQIDLQYERQIKVSHAYPVTVKLSSTQKNAPLSLLKGSVVDGQNGTLQDILGANNTPCVSISLVVDQAIFSVQPSQIQEYSLQQSQITWVWTVTPLRGDQQIPQDIPIRVIFSGKLHCGNGEALVGSYPLAGNLHLTVTVSEAPSAAIQSFSPIIYIFLSVLLILLIVFLLWFSGRLWPKRRKRRTLEMKTPGRKASLPVVKKMPLNIFYCYAHEDRALRNELEKHLSPLQRLERIINWYDGEIVPGTVWEDTIMMQLNMAHIILLLISPDFIASDYCYGKEMRRALERHEMKEALVIPIILRPVAWDRMPFAHLQVLPSEEQPVCLWTNRDEAFYNVVQSIFTVVEGFPTE